MLRRTPRPRLRSQAPVFAALGDPTRLALIARLSRRESCSIAMLTEGTELTRQAVTKHLRVLERAGVVRCTRQGRESLFVFDPAPLQHARCHLDALSEQWDRTLERLKIFVEDQ
ncbi:MAG TPA: metalloregulator ArsR/SmtB family transcription factor [Terracidiphilus sp.]|jgi:DNA-binding transcriptional ArsR family regulator|nr:metalloregulator ArsR/SmtB family transcription factor [Terracidiphilus sp.]